MYEVLYDIQSTICPRLASRSALKCIKPATPLDPIVKLTEMAPDWHINNLLVRLSYCNNLLSIHLKLPSIIFFVP
jgi:hypothetical protein